MSLKSLFIFFASFAFFLSTALAYKVSDAKGNVFEFASPPKIASVTPNITETVCALGKGDNLLGVSRYCSYPTGFDDSAKNQSLIKSKPALGGFIDPDYEKILMLKPDLFVFPITSAATQSKKVERLGIKVFYTYPEGIDSVEKNTMLLGELFDCKAKAQALILDFKNSVQTCANFSPNQRPRALVLFGKMAAGKGSFIGELLELCGFTNVVNSANNAWPVPSKESILTSNIEVLIIEAADIAQFNEHKAELLKDSVWRTTAAFKNDDVYFVETDAVIRPSLRLKKAALAFAEIRSSFIKKHKKD